MLGNLIFFFFFLKRKMKQSLSMRQTNEMARESLSILPSNLYANQKLIDSHGQTVIEFWMKLYKSLTCNCTCYMKTISQHQCIKINTCSKPVQNDSRMLHNIIKGSWNCILQWLSNLVPFYTMNQFQNTTTKTKWIKCKKKADLFFIKIVLGSRLWG